MFNLWISALVRTQAPPRTRVTNGSRAVASNLAISTFTTSQTPRLGRASAALGDSSLCLRHCRRRSHGRHCRIAGLIIRSTGRRNISFSGFPANAGRRGGCFGGAFRMSDCGSVHVGLRQTDIGRVGPTTRAAADQGQGSMRPSRWSLGRAPDLFFDLLGRRSAQSG